MAAQTFVETRAKNPTHGVCDLTIFCQIVFLEFLLSHYEEWLKRKFEIVFQIDALRNQKMFGKKKIGKSQTSLPGLFTRILRTYVCGCLMVHTKEEVHTFVERFVLT